jgi:acetyltransferase-like isoleucine patch superfamily enzyme
MRWLKKRFRACFNPHNLTRIHLKDSIDRHGFSVGDYSYGAPAIRWWGEKVTLSIGRYCSFADGVRIFLGGNHRSDWVTTYPFSNLPSLWPEAPKTAGMSSSRGDVTIGSDVWIGSQATILSGVAIGHGAIIGANAVVTRDVAPYAIVAGNPAREIRKRFSDAVIARLLDTAWWERDREAIAPLITLLQSDRVEELLAALAEKG